jgi:hypothetical protein
MSLVDSLSGHLAASKNRAFQERTRERFARFVGFLQENNLTIKTILEPGSYPDRDLVIRYEDLTDEGAAVVKAAYHKWLQGIDNGKPPSDLGTLEAALAKVRRQ